MRRMFSVAVGLLTVIAIGAAPRAAASPPPAAPTGDAAIPWIVYQSMDGLRLLTPDGTASRPVLPEGPSQALHADWSPDGARLAFAVDDPDGTRDLWVADWDGSNAHRLIDCAPPCRDNDGPAWSPDGSAIAFTRIDNIDGHNPGSQLQVVDVVSGAITTVAGTDGADSAAGPRWSPDGRSIVVFIDRYIDDGNDTSTMTGRAIAVVDLDDQEAVLRPITTFESFSSYPDWHPTDDLIVFGAGAVDPLDPNGPPENLFSIRPDGSALTQLTFQDPDDDLLWMPAFRPDGSEILVTITHRPSGDLTLGAVGADGSGLVELGAIARIPGAHSRQRPVPGDTGRSSTYELRPAPDLATPRAWAQLVTLDDGRVLVIGGNGAITTAEIYDPATGASVVAGPMASAEWLSISSSVKLDDGRVLVVGDARSGVPYAVAQVFDPASLEFEAVGPMVTPRAGAALALLGDGRVLMTGGTPPDDPNTTLASAELFDPETLAFSATGSMGMPRADVGITTLLDERVLVVGGEYAAGGGATMLNSAEIYDPMTSTFKPTGAVSSLAGRHQAITLTDGRVIVFARGGYWRSAARPEVWDPATETFSRAPWWLHPIVSATLLRDGRLFLVGLVGRDATWSGVYDPVTWGSVATQAPRAWWPAATRLNDGRALVVGGMTDGNLTDDGHDLGSVVATVEILDEPS